MLFNEESCATTPLNKFGLQKYQGQYIRRILQNSKPVPLPYINFNISFLP